MAYWFFSPIIVGVFVGRSVSLLLSDLDDSQKKSREETDDADTPDPEEAVFDMILDLYICKTDTKEGCRYNRTDKCCTVTADYHNDGDMCRKYTEVSCDFDKDWHQSEEERVCIEHQCKWYCQNTNDQWQEASHGHWNKSGKYSRHIVHDSCFLHYAEEYTCAEDC